MTPYFINSERIARLSAVIASWMETPYKHWCGVKGEGCDCIHFVCRVLEECGFAKKPYQIPWYPKDWHLHNSAELLLDGLRDQVPHIEADSPGDGDIMLFKFGKTLSHSAIHIGGYLHHSLNDVGVIRTRLHGSKWDRRIAVIMRPAEDAKCL